MDAISGILFLSSEVTRSSNVNVLYREYSRRCLAQCYRFFSTSWTLVSSLGKTCAQLNLAMITVQFNNAKRRFDILKLHFVSDGRIGRLKQVKRAK